MDIEHLLVHFFHGHSTTENGGNGQVATVTGIASGHHVFGVEHLLGQLRDSQRPVKIIALKYHENYANMCGKLIRMITFLAK